MRGVRGDQRGGVEDLGGGISSRMLHVFFVGRSTARGSFEGSLACDSFENSEVPVTLDGGGIFSLHEVGNRNETSKNPMFTHAPQHLWRRGTKTDPKIYPYSYIDAVPTPTHLCRDTSMQYLHRHIYAVSTQTHMLHLH